MSDPWSYDSELLRDEVIRNCRDDRDNLLAQLFELYPELRGQRPGAVLKDVIREVCGFRIRPGSLPRGQLALCDFRSRIVSYNTDIQQQNNLSDAIFEAVVTGNLAHELGHIRLHPDDVTHRSLDGFLRGDGAEIHYDFRSWQREAEADLYAVVFLVPGRLLLEEPEGLRLYHWYRGGECRSWEAIEAAVRALAPKFHVTQTLMRRALVELGWLERPRDAPNVLQIRRKPVQDYA